MSGGVVSLFRRGLRKRTMCLLDKQPVTVPGTVFFFFFFNISQNISINVGYC